MPEWLPTLLASITGGGVASYVGVRVALADISVRLLAVEREIGDRHSGIRGQLHKHHNWINKHSSRLMRLEEKAGIPTWDDQDHSE